jgi:hypothetical protein
VETDNLKVMQRQRLSYMVTNDIDI